MLHETDQFKLESQFGQKKGPIIQVLARLRNTRKMEYCSYLLHVKFNQLNNISINHPNCQKNVLLLFVGILLVLNISSIVMHL